MIARVDMSADRVTVEIDGAEDTPGAVLLRAAAPHVPEGWRVVRWHLMREPRRLTLRAEREPERWLASTTEAIDAMRREAQEDACTRTR